MHGEPHWRPSMLRSIKRTATVDTMGQSSVGGSKDNIFIVILYKGEVHVWNNVPMHS